MTWTRAFAYVALWLILTAVYLLPRGTPRRQTTEGVDVEAAQATRGVPVQELKAEDVVEVEVTGEAGRIRFMRDGDRWVVAPPFVASVSSDLVSARVSAIFEASGVQQVSTEETRDGEFGLDQPEARVRFATGDGAGVELAIGKENPAQTGVYGRASGSPAIVLVGLNARYYVRLILRAVG